jgi:hypothetical protein
MKRILLLRSLGVVLFSALVQPSGCSGTAVCSSSLPQVDACKTEGEQCTSTSGGCAFSWTCNAGEWSGSGVTVDATGGKVWGSGTGPASDLCGSNAPSAQACVTECTQCIYGDGGCFQVFTCQGGRWKTEC